MLSAVFGTVKSLLLQDSDTCTSTKEDATKRSSENTHPTKSDDKGSSKSPYDGLQYGQFVKESKEGDGKETPSFSGKVTDLLYGYGLINNDVYFTYDCVVGGQHPIIGSMVDVVAVRDHDKGGWKATRVALTSDWDITDTSPSGQNQQQDALIGTITKVAQDSGFINENVPFDQDSLVYGYKPCRGDWIQGDVTYDSADGGPRARNVRPLREQKFSGSVTHAYPGYGHVNGRIYFSFRVCEGGWRPKKGDLVDGKMIESEQSKGTWRAIAMKQDTRNNRLRLVDASDSPFTKCLKEDLRRNTGGITITDNLDLGMAFLGSDKSTTACIRNVGHEAKTLTHYEVSCPTGDVVIKFGLPGCKDAGPSSLPPPSIDNEATLPMILPSQTAVYVTLTVKAKQLGKCLCQVTFHFGDFCISRLCTLNSQNQQVVQLIPEGYSSGGNRLSRNRRRGKRDESKDDDLEGCIFPGVRPTRNYDVNVPVKLPQYPVPRDLKTCVLDEGDLVKTCPQLLESLCLENFSRRFSALLHLEEIQMEQDMREFDLERVSLRPRGEFLSLEVPGLAEGRPSVLIGDKIILTHPNTIRYDGYVHEVFGEAVLLKFHPSFHELYQAEECSVIFTYSRSSMRRCHQACDFAKNLGSQVLFPTKVEAKPPQVSVPLRRHAATLHRRLRSKPRVIVKLQTPQKQSSTAKPLRFSNKRLNETPPRFAKERASPYSESDGAKFVTPRIQELKMSHIAGDGQKMAEFINPHLNSRQQSAVIRILQGEGRPLPYIIFGPPGTGKTVTVVEAILQVHKHLPSSRILACTPSNSAADLLTERLHESDKVNPGDLVRLNAFHRTEENIPASIKSYCKHGENLSVISHQRIIICTCNSAGRLYQLGLKAGHFSHVFVDEAGQATEPECLVPSGLAVGPEGQIILAGDPMQLGPVLCSQISKQYGLDQSYLERLIQRTVYWRDAEKYRDHGCYDPLLVTKLVENYRSHPALLKLSSQLFYHNELLPMADPKLTHSLTSWEKLPNKDGDCPLLFHGVMGDDMKEGNSPSWFNPVEVVQVIRYVQALLGSTSPVIDPEDIGIISPYRKQVEKVKMLLISLSIDGIKVGSVEEFQGQERVVMIISTVRSSEDLLTFDLRHHLGFLSNPKRFNVSITRAQALMVIVGNPHVLAKDKHWRALLRYCMESGAYTGCQAPAIPPKEHDDEESLDGSQEPDIASPRQQETEDNVVKAAHVDSIKESNTDNHNRVEPVSNIDNSVIEKVEEGKLTTLNGTLNSQSHNSTVGDIATRETNVSPEKLEVNLADVDSKTNSVDQNVGIVKSDSSAAEELLDCLPSGASKSTQYNKTAVNNSIKVCTEMDKTVTSQQNDLADEPPSLIANGHLPNSQHENDPSTHPSVKMRSASNEQHHLINEDEFTSHGVCKGNDVTRTILRHPESKMASGQASSSKDIISDGVSSNGFLDERQKTTMTFTPHCVTKKQRAHSSLSFSSSSDLDDHEEFGEFLDDLDLNEGQIKDPTLQGQKSNVHVSQDHSIPSHTQASACGNVEQTDENSVSNHQPRVADEVQIHQKANTEALWSSGTFSDPEVCDPDEPFHPSPPSYTSNQAIHAIRGNVISSIRDNQTSPAVKKPSSSINRLIPRERCTQEMTKLPESVTTCKEDSFQICDGEEDPEVWDEEYNFSNVSLQPQDARSLRELPPTGTGEPQSEVTEKWDDYTWEVPAGTGDQSLHDHAVTPEKTEVHHVDVESQISTLESNPCCQEQRDSGRVKDRIGSEPPAETGLVDADEEMPPLEDWSQVPAEGMNCTDNWQDDKDVATRHLTARSHYLGHKVDTGTAEYSTNHSRSHCNNMTTTTATCGLRDNNQVVASTSPVPLAWGIGRGRGLKLRQGGTAGQSISRPGGHTSPFKNPWKVSAPTYTFDPKAMTHQQPIQHVHNHQYEMWHHGEAKHADHETTSPDCEFTANEGSIQQDDDHSSNHEADHKCEDSVAISKKSGCHDDLDDWDGSQHPHFIYRKPLTSHKKGGKWKYASKTTNDFPRSDCKRYTTDEDFMGEAKYRVNTGNQRCQDVAGCMRTDPRWMASYPVAQNAEMMEDYDVIIESNDDESSDNASASQRD